MRKISSITVVLGLALFLFTGCAQAAESASVEPLRIAVFQSITGTAATGSKFQVDAMQLCADVWNELYSINSLGGAKIELVWVDNMSDVNSMKTIVENTFSDPNYCQFGVLQGSSTYTMPAIASISKAGIPTFTKARGDAIFEQGCKNIYCITSISSVQANTPMEFLNFLKEEVGVDTTKIGILCVDNEFGIATKATYEKLIGEMDGFDFVFSELYPANISDMSSTVTVMKSEGVEILLSATSDMDAKVLFNNMRQMQFFPLNLTAGAGVTYPSFYQEQGRDIIGVLCASASNAFTTTAEQFPDFMEVRRRCYEKFGHLGGDFLACFYSMIQIAAQCVESTGSRDWAVNNAAMQELKFNTVYQTVDEDGTPNNVQYFLPNGHSPNSQEVVVQFQEIELNGKKVIEPVAVYPSTFAVYDLLREE